MNEVIVVIGSGQIGLAIARRIGVGKHIVLADLHVESADSAAKVMIDAGYDVSVASVDASSRDAVRSLVETATARGSVTGLVHAAGVSPSQARIPALQTRELAPCHGRSGTLGTPWRSNQCNQPWHRHDAARKG